MLKSLINNNSTKRVKGILFQLIVRNFIYSILRNRLLLSFIKKKQNDPVDLFFKVDRYYREKVSSR